VIKSHYVVIALKPKYMTFCLGKNSELVLK
jgi:hypothetical protein